MEPFAFADAVLPAQARVLRLPLRPYSIGHELILLRQRNPLVIFTPDSFSAASIPEQCDALIKAALICSRSWSEQNQKQRWMRVWNFLLSRKELSTAQSLAVEIQKFREYRKAGTTFPAAPNPDWAFVSNGHADRGRMLGGDVLVQCTNFLQSKCKALNYATVWDIPMGVALHLYFTQCELDGSRMIENEDEKAIAEEMTGWRVLKPAEVAAKFAAMPQEKGGDASA